jgi:hypothetical protein
VKEFVTRAVDAFVGMGCEAIPLRLQQVGRSMRAIVVEVTERRGQRGSRDTMGERCCGNASLTGLGAFYFFTKVG